MKTNYIFISIILILISAVGYLGYRSYTANDFDPRTIRDRDGIPNGSGMRQEGMPTDRGNALNQSKQNCLSDGCLALEGIEYPVDDLPQIAIDSLNKAIDDEYKAYATYDAIINEFGNVRPFIMIIRAEEQHISSLKALFDKYGLEIPENQYVGTISAPETLSEACTEGVNAEIANADLYREELLPAVSEYEDITSVFSSLMNASQNKHLPAFQRCAQ